MEKDEGVRLAAGLLQLSQGVQERLRTSSRQSAPRRSRAAPARRAGAGGPRAPVPGHGRRAAGRRGRLPAEPLSGRLRGAGAPHGARAAAVRRRRPGRLARGARRAGPGPAAGAGGHPGDRRRSSARPPFAWSCRCSSAAPPRCAPPGTTRDGSRPRSWRAGCAPPCGGTDEHRGLGHRPRRGPGADRTRGGAGSGTPVAPGRRGRGGGSVRGAAGAAAPGARGAQHRAPGRGPGAGPHQRRGAAARPLRQVALQRPRADVPARDRPSTAAHGGPGGLAREAHRAPRHGRQGVAHRGQPAPGGLGRQALRGPRPRLPRPHPGGQPGPHPGGREVRLPQGLQVLDLRHLVDPPGHHPSHRRPGPHDPRPGAHGRDDQPALPRPAPAPPGPGTRAHRRRAGEGARGHPGPRARDPEGGPGAGLARDPGGGGRGLRAGRPHRGRPDPEPQPTRWPCCCGARSSRTCSAS